ncbi:hypothetical protein PS15m_001201 [Mucor circinelloides]
MSASSASIKMIKLSDTDKNSIKALYDSLDKTKMWTLSTGTVVEEQMEQFALSREHEYLSHSLVFDVNDNCWESYFTDAKIKEIKEFNAVPLPVLPYDVKTYLDELEATSNADLYGKVNATQFEPNTDCKWIQDSYNSCFRLLKSGFFPLNDVTEQGIGKRIWSCLDTCFDFSTIRCVSGEKCSRASADAANINRSNSDLNRQHCGQKMDHLFKTRVVGDEVG